jgi:UTP-glucose-1-phosphate uridylyltransferase/mevalonate kinase
MDAETAEYNSNATTCLDAQQSRISSPPPASTRRRRAISHAAPGMPAPVTVFVPGRVCLVGEHSDWAGAFRESNLAIARGHAIVANTHEGLRGTCAATRDTRLVLDSSFGGEASYATDQLLAAARDNDNPWRYAAGVAYVMNDRYGTAGAEISIQSNLPTRKGLSSSAALCVLVARAFNELFNLRLTTSGEMDIAYAGERLTGSLCGRMDQCVAFGRASVAHMSFDSDIVTHVVLPRTSAPPVYLVFADLCADKDTSIILQDLRAAYPVATTDAHHRLHDALGPQNEQIILKAIEALHTGDAKRLGAVFDEAQSIFDAVAVPLCPIQLTAPVLHKYMHHPSIRPLIDGAKGVGSQGDGTIQFAARGKPEAELLLGVLGTLGLSEAHILPIGECSEAMAAAAIPDAEARASLNEAAALSNSNAHMSVKREVKTAVITAAGYGTRLFPASRSIRPKALMPIIDRDGYVKPLLLHLVEQCVEVGMDKIVIVTGPGDQVDRVREVFSKVEGGLAKALKPHMVPYAAKINDLESMVHIAVQETPEGFGHAVSMAAPLLKDKEPFMLLLGDVAFKAEDSASGCLRQVLDVFERDPLGRSVIGTSDVPASEASAYGVVNLAKDKHVCAMDVVDLVEKPDAEKAAEFSDNGMCKIVLGPYVFSHNVMDALVKDVIDDSRLSAEIQLTPAIVRVKEAAGLLAVELDGEALDTGNPAEYAQTMTILAEYALNK